MSRAKLNIWLRFRDCSLITDCWMTDLVVKSCCGEYLVDMDKTIIDQLRKRYPDFAIVDVLPNYHGETRIRLRPPHGQYINHIELDVPPGCYVVWTRVCHGHNEETNKFLAIADCGDHVCVNLLLNSVETCGNHFIHPFLVQAVQLNLQREQLIFAADAVMRVAKKPKKELHAELNARLEEIADRQDPVLERAIGIALEVIRDVPG